MREVKFRAWDRKGKEGMFEIFNSESQKDWFLPLWKERYEVMQYTGLKDNNGKEIYEHDIVKSKPTKHLTVPFLIFEVIWLPQVACWGYMSLQNIAPKIYSHYELSNVKYGINRKPVWFPLEIIGNIYENPKLLQESP